MPTSVLDKHSDGLLYETFLNFFHVSFRSILSSREEAQLRNHNNRHEVKGGNLIASWFDRREDRPGTMELDPAARARSPRQGVERRVCSVWSVWYRHNVISRYDQAMGGGRRRYNRFDSSCSFGGLRASALEYCRRSAMNSCRLSARRWCLSEMKNVQNCKSFADQI